MTNLFDISPQNVNSRTLQVKTGNFWLHYKYNRTIYILLCNWILLLSEQHVFLLLQGFKLIFVCVKGLNSRFIIQNSKWGITLLNLNLFKQTNKSINNILSQTITQGGWIHSFIQRRCIFELCMVLSSH